MVVLEAEDSPRKGYGFVSGYAFANDLAENICGGLAEASLLALADARMNAQEIEVINAWGPGHRLIDAGESRAMQQVFGSALREIAAISIKGAIGSALGAAPAIQLGVAALALQNGMIPATVNWEFPDPACLLNLSAVPRVIAHDATLVNAHGVGDVNSCLIIQRC